MTSKVCTKCTVELPLSAFGKDAQKSDGLCSHCRPCRLAASRVARGITPDRYFAFKKVYSSACEKLKAWRAKNPERMYARNPIKQKEAHKRWRDANIERERVRVAQWSKDNPDKAAALSAKRRACMKMAAPVWADMMQIEAVYSAAQSVSEATGVPHHVDHIVPLNGRTVCGLHVPSNLQVITASANSSKGNRSWPDMP